MRGNAKRKRKAARPRSGTASGGRPTLVEASRRQQHLLDVAGAMFSRRGFDGTSVDAVAVDTQILP